MNQELPCQSCGMPMKNQEDFGSNKDGSNNQEYCRFCFQQGAFTEPDLTLDQMIDKAMHFLIQIEGISSEEAETIVRTTIPKLKRWSK